VTASAEPDVHSALIQTALRLLDERGPGALTARRLAAEVGASTMAVYTHFGGMRELRRAIQREGISRIAEAWRAVELTPDPVADLSVSGASYVFFALRNPNLYRAMFFEMALDEDDEVVANAITAEVSIIQRCIDAGRFNQADPWSLRWTLWAATHGVVAGILAGVIKLDAAEQHFDRLGVSLFVGFGDSPSAARRSQRRARERVRQPAA
jgi:AcrR family transcriptional regulator